MDPIAGDRVKWVRPVRICRRRFVTEEEVIRHVQEEHPSD